MFTICSNFFLDFIDCKLKDNKRQFYTRDDQASTYQIFTSYIHSFALPLLIEGHHTFLEYFLKAS